MDKDRMLDTTHEFMGSSARLLLAFINLPPILRDEVEGRAREAAQGLIEAAELWSLRRIEEATNGS